MPDEVYIVTKSDMEEVAGAIRTAGGTSASLAWPTGWKNAVAAIPSGSGGGSATLVSKNITANGTYDPANDNADGYSSVTVALPAGTAGTPTATKGAVSNHSISVTPSVTNTAGVISGGTVNGTAVTVSASELVSGSETKTTNGTYDVTNLAQLIVNVSPLAKTKTGTFTGNGTRQVTISCDFEPDLVYWYADPGTSSSSGTYCGLIARGLLAVNRYRNNSTSTSTNVQEQITNMNSGGSSYNFRATYANSAVTLYCFSSNTRSLFTNNRSYSYTFVKWTV